MSGEQLTALKEQLAALSPQEKLELAKFLQEHAAADLSGSARAADTDHDAAAQKQAQHLAWLKAHREEYAGLYVALDGDRLVGSGASMREAREQALQAGSEHPFITHVSSANDAPFGGW
jgi:hypothetical protein